VQNSGCISRVRETVILSSFRWNCFRQVQSGLNAASFRTLRFDHILPVLLASNIEPNAPVGYTANKPKASNTAPPITSTRDPELGTDPEFHTESKTKNPPNPLNTKNTNCKRKHDFQKMARHLVPAERVDWMALKVRHDTFEKNFSCKDLASSSSMLLSFGAVYVFFMGEPHEHLGFLPSWVPAENTTRTSHLHLEFAQIQRSPSRIVMLSVFPSHPPQDSLSYRASSGGRQ